jgi:uncharacterized protein (TIGR02284 family)
VADSTDGMASTLSELIQVCKDGEHGFQSAALLVDDLNLRRLFESYAQQRAEFTAELQLELRRLVVDPAETGQDTAAIQRSGIDLKAGMAGNDEGAVISERERAEDEAVRQYQAALAVGLPSDLKSIVERQYLQLKEAHDHVRSLQQACSRHG